MSYFQNEIEKIFSERGLLSSLPNFEYRESQKEMALAIAHSLEVGSHKIIEAPTGIGKSFAYLIPSIIFSISEKRKAIISTCTINLQEQLIQKDIPTLQNLLPYNFRPEILKGRHNYICLKRLNNTLLKKDSLFVSDEQEQLQKIYNFINKNNKGTIQDFPFKISENIWSQIFAEEGICTSKSCGSENSNCFYQQAKIKLKSADLIILNHYLFFTIFGLFEGKDNGFIYSNDFVIFDEAHQIEQIAAENVSPSISKEQIRFWLLKLYNSQKDKGFLADPRFKKLAKKIDSLLSDNDYFFIELEDFIQENYNNKINNKVLRFRDPLNLNSKLCEILKSFAQDLNNLKPASKNDDEENEITNFSNKLLAFSHTIHDFLNHSFNDFVYWIELSKGYKKNIKLCMSPIDMSDFFRNNIFIDSGPVIMTSATLSVNKSLEYFKRSVGAEAESDLMLDSSFDFMKQMKIIIYKNIPEPTAISLKKIKDYYTDNLYESTLKDKIKDSILMSRGGALILFTNIRLMKKIYEQVRDELRTENINFYAQGEGLPKNKLINEFKNNLNSVLFGVDSFWMGVDIPGNSLRNVTITKLPFDVPDHPLIEAKIELINQRGGNPFMEFYLPGAILKFKQGIGRLIRNKTDYGIVVITDSRILNKFYGKMFINSLPQSDIILED